jgi:hypothetical protein
MSCAAQIKECIPLRVAKYALWDRFGHAQLFCGQETKGRNDSIKACLSIIIKDDGVMASVAQVIIGKVLRRSALWTLVPGQPPKFHGLRALCERA